MLHVLPVKVLSAYTTSTYRWVTFWRNQVGCVRFCFRCLTFWMWMQWTVIGSLTFMGCVAGVLPSEDGCSGLWLVPEHPWVLLITGLPPLAQDGRSGLRTVILHPQALLQMYYLFGEARWSELGLNQWHSRVLLQVYYLLKKMDEVGCDLFLDIHGDEEIPFNFLAGSEGIPSFNERLRELQDTFSTAFVRASPDFQPKNGYTVDEPGKANLAISSNGVSTVVCCFTVTICFKNSGLSA